MAPTARPRVLCVDDEANLLEGLKLLLERRFDVHTAANGAEGLARIRDAGPFAVVLSDMRMPEMSGAEFLSRVREGAPLTVRMLLTGQTDLESAVRAVNDGQLFRFITKPCPPSQLVAAIECGVEQHRLQTAERQLLEETLTGSVKVLNEVLGLAHPEAFGRASRIKQLVSELAEECRIERRWELETAAMLSQLGCITIERETLVRAHQRQMLSAEESRALARVPEVSCQLISHIPRLEGVREILSLLVHPAGLKAAGAVLRRSAEALRIAVDFDWLEARSASAAEALDDMRASDRYDAELFGAFERLRRKPAPSDAVRPVVLKDLREGMILDEDARTKGGVLFATRGYVVTQAFVERALNFRAAGLPGSLRCKIPAGLLPDDGHANESCAA